MKLTDLIGEALPNIDLDSIVGKKLVRELEKAVKTAAVSEVAKITARGLVKGIDAFAAAAVKHLAPAETQALMDAYAAALQVQIEQLAMTTNDYAPLALDVESNKKRFGGKSPEANAARKRREVGIAEMRAEVKDVLLAAVGSDALD